MITKDEIRYSFFVLRCLFYAIIGAVVGMYGMSIPHTVIVVGSVFFIQYTTYQIHTAVKKE